MSAALLILCLAAFAMVAAVVSALIAASLSWLDRLATWIAPRHGVRLWLAWCALPSVIGVLTVAASFLPALGVGHDHCLVHGSHHPHLCPHHLGAAPGIVLVLVAGLLALRALYVAIELIRGLHSSHETSRLLAEASERHDGVLVFPCDEPQAFVLGGFHPRVHVSRGLLALGRDVVEPVLAHERVHARYRDLLWRALCPALALGHLPLTIRALRARFVAAQELAADAEAADALPNGSLRIAEALVVLARFSQAPSPGISFTQGDVQARVHALLEGRRAHRSWCARLLLLGALLLPLAVGASHDLIHHGLETLLGALS